MIVRTQQELDAALAAGESYIEIRSPQGVWLTISDSKSSSVEARGSSSVVARGSSRVVAWESSRVVARESSSVEAWESSSVEARGSSRVVARGSSRVVARESSSVVAWESSRVVARESSSVVAWESSSVEAWESSSVEASSMVAIHLHSAAAIVSGGVVIDMTAVDTDPAKWCEYHGIKVSKAGVATLYKAVNDNWTTSRGTSYAPGTKPSAPDWRDDQSCGGGLHFGPTPRHALDYHQSASKFVEVGVRVADLRPIPGGIAKCKAPRVVRACVEVTIDGKRVQA